MVFATDGLRDWLSGALATQLALLSGLLQFAVPFGEDLSLAAFQLVLGGQVADGAVQANGVVQLQPDAVDAAGVHGEADPLLGRTGHQRRPGSLGPGDDDWNGARKHGFGEPSGGGAGLWAAGRKPAGGDAEVRHRDLRVRAGLPAGLRPDRIAAWQYELRVGHRRHAPGELEAGRHGPRSPRPAHGALVNTARQQQ